MADGNSKGPYYAGKVYRIVWGSAGVLCVGMGLLVMFEGVVSMPLRLAIGWVLVLFGSEAVKASMQFKVSWLARLFPLI